MLAAVLPGGVPVDPRAAGPDRTGGGTDTGDRRRRHPDGARHPGGGALSGAVDNVDEATGSLGLPAVGDTTGPLTDEIDRNLNDTLNGVGGALGQPNLGDDVNDTVRNLSDGLVGREGLTGRLLGGN